MNICQAWCSKTTQHMLYLLYNTCYVMLYNTWYVMLYNTCYVMLLLPGISRQQTIFLSDLRFLVRWFDGSMVWWFNGSMVQSARWPISKCLAAAPVFLFRAIRHFVLFSCEFKICAEVVVHRMFAVFLNSLNGKNSSRTIVRDIFSFFFLC